MVISITVTWILLESDRVIFMQLSARPPDVNSVQVDAPTTNHLDKAALKITKKWMLAIRKQILQRDRFF